MSLDEARVALAEAVTTGGLACLPYPPENPSPPIAFVDDLSLDFTGGGIATTFCLPGAAAATIVSIAQRNDRPGAMAHLESFIPGVIEALQNVPGLRVATAGSGQLNVGGQDLPAVTYQVTFAI